MQNWQPEPVSAGGQRPATPSQRAQDIISMLVQIYGSKDLFINEYRYGTLFTTAALRSSSEELLTLQTFLSSLLPFLASGASF